MTREELEKEAEEYADKVKCEWESETYWVDCRDEVTDAYLAGAEPREKRITELEATNKKISDECHKLVDTLEKRQKEIAELKARLNSINLLTPELEKASKLRNPQLSRAKEIIKKIKPLYLYPVVTIDDVKRQNELLAEADEFLKECE